MSKTVIPQYYRLRITLTGADPLVWRQVLVPRDILLSDLHAVIQIAMGWEDDHLHEYVVGKKRYAMPVEDSMGLGEPSVNEEIVRLNGVAKPNAKFTYIYDFGDSWAHEVLIEAEVEASSAKRTAQCIQGANACPPEDCGGVFRYLNMLNILRDRSCAAGPHAAAATPPPVIPTTCPASPPPQARRPAPRRPRPASAA